MSRDMKRSELPRIAKSVLAKIEQSASRTACVCKTKTGYKVLTDEKASEDDNSGAVMEFRYTDKPAPTQEAIEASLHDVFIKIMH